MSKKLSSEARALRRVERQKTRMQAIKAVRNGRTVADVAECFGVSERTLFRWLSRFIEGGQSAVQPSAQPGRPPKVSAEEMRWLARVVRNETPQQMKFPYALWTLSLIRELIHRRLGKRLALSSVSRIMNVLGFTAQKPLYEAWQQDPELVRRWEREVYPAIRAEARRVGATIYFADESGLRSDYHTGTTWAPAGETPVIEKTGRRFAVNMISAVGPRGEFRFMVHEGTVNARVFRAFLQRLRVGATGPVFVVVDGHPAHKARIVQDYVRSTNGQLRLFFLPPYSPHLNPDELVWAQVKREVSRRCVQTLEQMKKLALAALRSIQRKPHLVKSFFHQPECRYALPDINS